jgi:hypothetical protein
LRDEDQRIRLKVFARYGEIDLLGALTGPGHSSYCRATGIRVGSDVERAREQGVAIRNNADGPVARLRGWREPGDGELGSEAQLRGIGKLSVVGRGGDGARGIQPFHAQLFAVTDLPGFEPEKRLTICRLKQGRRFRDAAGFLSN